ncbi:sialidase family protein [Negadavirga shengliensis]|uniref:Sialidase family protein n=1 Tax=Negadavirga shengliensis TaxID=1389218 RepID=A0ABV9SYI8_9BACT
MANRRNCILMLLSCLICIGSFAHSEGDSTRSERLAGKVEVLERYVSIDNVCAWPNLTNLADGTRIATIFDQPSHARNEGSVACYVSSDNGRFWQFSGNPASHESLTNRMNVAAGISSNGDVLVIASGWSLLPAKEPGGQMSLDGVLRAWVSRSKDGGSTWEVDKDAFPAAEEGMTNFIPFGDILVGADGTLRVLAYAQSLDKAINKVAMFKSEDDGGTWSRWSYISEGSGETAFSGGHNETAFYHNGKGNWVAAARRWRAGQAMDLFQSGDDGQSWQFVGSLTGDNQHPGHLTALNDGSLLLTYGNRKEGQRGVAVKTSRDNGITWSEERLVIDDLDFGVDCGYPTSVQLEDGSIMTLYYSKGIPSHQRYHMGTVIWEFPPGQER